MIRPDEVMRRLLQTPPQPKTSKDAKKKVTKKSIAKKAALTRSRRQTADK